MTYYHKCAMINYRPSIITAKFAMFKSVQYILSLGTLMAHFACRSTNIRSVMVAYMHETRKPIICYDLCNSWHRNPLTGILCINYLHCTKMCQPLRNKTNQVPIPCDVWVSKMLYLYQTL